MEQVNIAKPTIIGLISDTHGLLREEAVAALAGSDLIIHAGDVGKPQIIERLQALAPVLAVKGNIDIESWARSRVVIKRGDSDLRGGVIFASNLTATLSGAA